MKRPLILLGLLTAGLSTAFLLPDFRQTPSAVRMEIQEKLGAWTAHQVQETKAERDTLAPDTRFAKAVCLKPRDGNSSFFYTGPQDVAHVSIVLSGFDLANSIHRPERCMPAQGHEIYQSEKLVVAVKDNRQVPVRRLLSVQTTKDEKTGVVSKYNTVTYYFFVGHERITENHTRRTLFDIKDRLMNGEAQGWAYISVTMAFGSAKAGLSGELPDFETADLAVRNLLGELSTTNIAWEQIRVDA
jgi:hypothetical protein